MLMFVIKAIRCNKNVRFLPTYFLTHKYGPFMFHKSLFNWKSITLNVKSHHNRNFCEHKSEYTIVMTYKF